MLEKKSRSLLKTILAFEIMVFFIAAVLLLVGIAQYRKVSEDIEKITNYHVLIWQYDKLQEEFDCIAYKRGSREIFIDGNSTKHGYIEFIIPDRDEPKQVPLVFSQTIEIWEKQAVEKGEL